jgi:hypothetical protein
MKRIAVISSPSFKPSGEIEQFVNEAPPIIHVLDGDAMEPVIISLQKEKRARWSTWDKNDVAPWNAVERMIRNVELVLVFQDTYTFDSFTRAAEEIAKERKIPMKMLLFNSKMS